MTKEIENTFNHFPDNQALEHVNRSGKVAVGLVGITRTDSATDCWCITYNERDELSEDTKTMFNGRGGNVGMWEIIGKARLRRDEEDFLKLMSCFQRYEVFRPTENLLAVTTGDVASEEIKHDLLGAEEVGKTVVREFVEGRLIKKEVKFHDGVKQKKTLKTFETLYSVPVSVDNKKVVAVKADRDLFRRVVIAFESGRDIDVDELLQRELCAVPLSIATPKGSLREASGKVCQSQLPISQNKTCTIIDGMAAIQVANASDAKTFGEWCDKFSAYVTSHFSDKCTRVDVVFDRYLPHSIKGETRAKCKGGESRGIRRNVESRDQRIGYKERFIVVEDNKASLTHFLSTEISRSCNAHPRRELVLIGGFSDILKVWSSDVTREGFEGLASNHEDEEANTRIVLHAKDATKRGYSQVNVLCRGTGVLVFLLAHREHLGQHIWMFSGTSRNKQYIPVHKITLPEEKRKSLLAFHAITGCDTTSHFVGIGKQKTWKAFDGRSPELLKYLAEESRLNSNVLADGEAFVCQLYDKGTREVHVNKERAAIFRQC